jgi:hypothetical protein
VSVIVEPTVLAAVAVPSRLGVALPTLEDWFAAPQSVAIASLLASPSYSATHRYTPGPGAKPAGE